MSVLKKRSPKSWSPREKAPVPKPKETRRTRLPDDAEGMHIILGRLVKYVQDSRKDPVVLATAQKIAELAIGTARQIGRKVDGETRPLILLEGIHAWCSARFEYVPNPVNIQILKTPRRQLCELEIPEGLAHALWEPIRNRMAADAKMDPGDLKLPAPKISGNSGDATSLVLSLAAAVGISPLRMMLGGEDGDLHYAWGQAYAAGGWRDIDALHPKLGECHKFENSTHIDIPI